MARTVSVVYCYAHEDQALRTKLDKHLSVLRREGMISSWYDGEILPGSLWAKDIKDAFNKADIILFLVSADFIASDYCYSIEMEYALERHRRGEAHVIPILLRPVNLGSVPFKALQMIPTGAKPMTTWSDFDLACEDVVAQIRRLVVYIYNLRNAPTQVLAPSKPASKTHVTRVEHLGTLIKRYRESPTLAATGVYTVFFGIIFISAISGMVSWTQAQGPGPGWPGVLFLTFFAGVALLVVLNSWRAYLSVCWLDLYSHGFAYESRGQQRCYHFDEILSIEIRQKALGGKESVRIETYYMVNLVNDESIWVNHGAELKKNFERHVLQQKYR